MCSKSLTAHGVRLMGGKDATSLGDFPAFCNGMIVATLQMRGSEQVKKNELDMAVISGGPKEPTDLRNESAMLSGLAAPLPFILFDSR